MNMKPADRQALAGKCEIDDQYLYQILTGRREASPALCVSIEQGSHGAVMRWDLRPDDWHLIWPELKRKAGAPALHVGAA